MIDEREHLAHYGIKGQKHGVRRWQNEDGSLTPEGYRHYGIDPNRQKANLSVSGLQMARYKKDIFNKTYSDSRSSGLDRSESRKKAKEVSDKELDRVYGTRTRDFRRDPGLFKQYPIYKSEYEEERDSKSINAPKNFKILDNNLNKDSDTKPDQDRIKKENEFKKINESAEDFYKKKAEQQDKYEVMSAIGSCLSFNDSIGLEPSIRDMLNEIYGYKHEDGDQGNYSSLTFYTVDNNLEEEYEKLKKEASPFFRDLSFNSDAWTQGLNELFLSDLYNENEIKEYASKAKEIMSKFPGIENAEKVLDDSEYWNIPWSKLEPWQVAEINKKLSLAHSDDEDFLAHYTMIGEDFLVHWGIKGQKWGKRRFQNEDGSLTPEGRKRYGVGDMNDSELREAIELKRMQNRYRELTNKTSDKKNKRKEVVGLINDAANVLDLTSTLIGNTVLESNKDDLKKYKDDLKNQNVDRAKKIADLKKEDPNFPVDHIKTKIDETRQEIKDVDEAIQTIDTVKNTSKQATQSIRQLTSLADTVLDKAEKGKEATDISDLDIKELKEKVQRLLLEKEYENLVNPPKPSKVEKGREVFQTLTPILGLAVGATALILNIKHIIHGEEDNNMNDDVLTHYAMMGEDFLAHYGVKGQKRGIRRWQNEDGSLTPEGYRHYGIDPNTGRGENIVTARQIERYGKDIYKDSYRKAREEGYDRKQAKAQAVSDRASGAIKAYGAGRLAERARRIGKATTAGGLIGMGAGAARGGMIGARATEDGEMAGLGMAVGGVVGSLVGGKLGGAVAKRFGNYENKHIKAVDEIDDILSKSKEMNYDEIEKAVNEYNDKISEEYSKKYADLLDKNNLLNKNNKDVQQLDKEYRYLLETIGASFGTYYAQQLTQKVMRKLDAKQIEKMKQSR